MGASFHSYFIDSFRNLYASDIANRYWENDIEVKKAGCDPLQTVDIARQFIGNDVSKRLKIVLACGREEFRDKSMHDEESMPGKRGDRRDLINEWLANHEKEGKSKNSFTIKKVYKTFRKPNTFWAYLV